MCNSTKIMFTDSVTTCECCGKSELKGTYLVSNELGSENYYGSTCVKRNLKISQSDLTKCVSESLKAAKENAKNEYSNSEIHLAYNKAVNSNYEYMDNFYLNTVKPLSSLDAQLKLEILNKYNLKNF